jgi:hypothetical protein
MVHIGLSNDLYCVSLDGRVLHSGLSRSQAERTAAQLACGCEKKRPGMSRRVPEFDIKPDLAARQERERNYKTWKES